MNLMLTNRRVLTILHAMNRYREFFNSRPWEGCIRIVCWQGGVCTPFSINNLPRKPFPTPSQGFKFTHKITNLNFNTRRLPLV